MKIKGEDEERKVRVWSSRMDGKNSFFIPRGNERARENDATLRGINAQVCENCVKLNENCSTVHK